MNKTLLLVGAAALAYYLYKHRGPAVTAAGVAGSPGRPTGVAAGGMTTGERWAGVATSLIGNAVGSVANGLFGAAGGGTPTQRDIDIGAD